MPPSLAFFPLSSTSSIPSSHEISPLPSLTPSHKTVIPYLSFTISTGEVEVTKVKASESPTLVPEWLQVPILQASDSFQVELVPPVSFLPELPSSSSPTTSPSLRLESERVSNPYPLHPPSTTFCSLLQVQALEELHLLNQAEISSHWNACEAA